MLHSTYHYINGCSFWVNQCRLVSLLTCRHRDKGSEEPVEQILCMSCNAPKTGSHWLEYRTGHVTRSPACSFSRLSWDACTFQLDYCVKACQRPPESVSWHTLLGRYFYCMLPSDIQDLICCTECPSMVEHHPRRKWHTKGLDISWPVKQSTAN